MQWEGHLTTVVFPLNYNTSLIIRKTPDKLKLRGILQNTQALLLKTVKVMKSKEILRNFTDRRSQRKLVRLNACGILDAVLEQEKNIWERTGKILIQFII